MMKYKGYIGSVRYSETPNRQAAGHLERSCKDHLLASRKIPFHYDLAEFVENLKALKAGVILPFRTILRGALHITLHNFLTEVVKNFRQAAHRLYI